MIRHATYGFCNRTHCFCGMRRRFLRRTVVDGRWSFAKGAGSRLVQSQCANTEVIPVGIASTSTFICGSLRVRTFRRGIDFNAEGGISYNGRMDRLLRGRRSWRRAPVKRNERRRADSSKPEDHASTPPLSDTMVVLILAILAIALLLGYLLVNKLADISHEEDCMLAHRKNCAASKPL